MITSLGRYQPVNFLYSRNSSSDAASWCLQQRLWPLPTQQLSHIRSVVNVAAPVIYGKSRFVNIKTTLKDQLHWLQAPRRIVVLWRLLVYKALYGFAQQLKRQGLVESVSTANLSPAVLRSSVEQSGDSQGVAEAHSPQATLAYGIIFGLSHTIDETETVRMFKQRLNRIYLNCTTIFWKFIRDSRKWWFLAPLTAPSQY